MTDEPNEDTQKTQPKKGEPVEIPIPTESQIERDFTKIATATAEDNPYAELSDDELCKQIRAKNIEPATKPLPQIEQVGGENITELRQLVAEAKHRGLDC